MPAAQPSDPPRDSALQAVRRWVTGTLPGRFLAVGVLIKLIAWMSRVGLSPAAAERIDTVGDISLLIGGVLAVYVLFRDLRTVLLWRVRRKLTLSYIFIGFVPAALIIVLFLTAGTLLFFVVSDYVTRTSMRSFVDQAGFLAQSAAVGLQDASSPEEMLARLQRRQLGAERQFPLVSYAVVPTGQCAPGVTSPDRILIAGRWAHTDRPVSLPDWVTCENVGRLTAFTLAAPVAVTTATPPVTAYLVARAIAWPDEGAGAFAVVVDVPFSNALFDRIEQETGVTLGTAGVSAIINEEACKAFPFAGRIAEAPRPSHQKPVSTWNPFRKPLPWNSFLEYTDWESARTCRALMEISISGADLYSRLSGVQPGQTTPPSAVASPDSQVPITVRDLITLGMTVVGIMFLIIQVSAFMMGFALARSITGAIHELFAGTERVRRGDFTHKIVVQARDQLGELAESFNSMTSSIEDLLHEKAEKERMEQELRIARNIQMSLLPHGGITTPGLALSAHCEPAREVGGDYYDYMALSGNRLGLLVADVAGKGTSAALYMAELKGLMLSLTELHTSPRRLLIDANRIICRHLDTRSFITITYAVVDTDAGTLTYARAGHCPLIYVPGSYAVDRTAQILAPDGLVLGLQIDNGERFDQLLVESTLRIGPGDVFLFFTDGLTEAMDRDGNCFGDTRLATVVQQHADLPSDELRERILRDIGSFSTDTDQQDDMTMLLLKVEHLGTGHAVSA